MLVIFFTIASLPQPVAAVKRFGGKSMAQSQSGAHVVGETEQRQNLGNVEDKVVVDHKQLTGSWLD